jgi:hypothetical protein
VAVHVDSRLNIRINDKIVHFTIHVRDEIDEYGKDTLFVCEIVDKGKRELVSRQENRYESRLAVGGITWIVIWFDIGDRILVKHLGKKR